MTKAKKECKWCDSKIGHVCIEHDSKFYAPSTKEEANGYDNFGNPVKYGLTGGSISKEECKCGWSMDNCRKFCIASGHNQCICFPPSKTRVKIEKLRYLLLNEINSLDEATFAINDTRALLNSLVEAFNSLQGVKE